MKKFTINQKPGHIGSKMQKILIDDTPEKVHTRLKQTKVKV